jgi:hypothetical protein
METDALSWNCFGDVIRRIEGEGIDDLRFLRALLGDCAVVHGYREELDLFLPLWSGCPFGRYCIDFPTRNSIGTPPLFHLQRPTKH